MKRIRVRKMGRRHVLALLLVLIAGVIVMHVKLSDNVVSPVKSRAHVIGNKYQSTAYFSTIDERSRDPDSSDSVGDRIRLFCNSPFTETNGAEGNGPDGFKLRMVHIFTRHGARTPLSHTRARRFSIEHFECNFSKFHQENEYDDTFKMFPEHLDNFLTQGKRIQHFETYPLYPNNETCGYNSLTALGALQHLKLGQFISNRYINNDHLFDRKSSLTSQMHVRSSQVVRAFQSAVAFLYGLLPNFDLSNVTVTQSVNMFMCQRGDISCTCKVSNQFDARKRKLVHSEKRKLVSNNSLKERVKTDVNDNRDSVPDSRRFMDVLTTFYCHSKLAPCFSSSPKVCLAYRDLNTILDDNIRGEVLTLKDPERNALKWSYLVVYPVIMEISERMQDYVTSKAEMTSNVFSNITDKLILYSGHDHTIRALLTLFGIYDGMTPPFAARFAIELYEPTIQENKQRFYLRFLYNGNDVTNDVHFCREGGLDSLCGLDNLKTFLFSSIQELFNTSDYSTACKGNKH